MKFSESSVLLSPVSDLVLAMFLESQFIPIEAEAVATLLLPGAFCCPENSIENMEPGSPRIKGDGLFVLPGMTDKGVG